MNEPSLRSILQDALGAVYVLERALLVDPDPELARAVEELGRELGAEERPR